MRKERRDRPERAVKHPVGDGKSRFLKTGKREIMDSKMLVADDIDAIVKHEWPMQAGAINQESD